MSTPARPDGLHDDEHGLAVHEAGHAVAWVRLRVPFTRVALLEDDPLGRQGAVFGSPVGLVHGDASHYLAGLLAGSLAESAFTGRDLDEIARTCGAFDFAIADALCTNLAPREVDDNLRRAERLVHRNARQIALVAAVLIDRRSLDHATVQRLVLKGDHPHDHAIAA